MSTRRDPEAREMSERVAPFAKFKDGGYPRLANLMSYDDMAVFRKFGTMNSYVLLSLQAELLELEEQLQSELLDSDHSTDEAQNFTRNFWLLRDNAAKATHNPSGSRRHRFASGDASEAKASSSKASVPEQSAARIKEIIDTVRCKLEQYNHFLVLFSQVSNLRSAKKTDFQRLHEWLRGNNKGEGNQFLARNPFEYKTWGKEFLDDFLLLDSGSDDKDLFSRDVSPLVIRAARWVGFNKLKTPIDESGTVVYSGLTPFLKVFTTSLAAILPAVSILALYYCPTMALRIGVMIVITFAFSIILSVFTSAKRIEIFSATAAFAAVEVVFIGSARLRDG